MKHRHSLPAPGESLLLGQAIGQTLRGPLRGTKARCGSVVEKSRLTPHRLHLPMQCSPLGEAMSQWCTHTTASGEDGSSVLTTGRRRRRRRRHPVAAGRQRRPLPARAPRSQ